MNIKYEKHEYKNHTIFYHDECEASEYYFERELSEERDYEIDMLKEAVSQ